MKLYAPKYYLDFVCIADQCRHSCCVGWEIDIDDKTMCRYASLTEPYAACVRESIEYGETPHFRLGESERCPHLNDQGLCRIILTLGEDYLCDICREHPRFYHTTGQGMEVGLGMACEEACRLILASDDYRTFVEIETLEDADEDEHTDFDATAHRARLYELLSDRTRPYAERLACIASEYGVALTQRTDGEWRRMLASLEYLDEAHRELFHHYCSAAKVEATNECLAERALAYFIFRHCSDACDLDELRSGLGLALLCERLLVSLMGSTRAEAVESIVELARIISEELEYSEDNTQTLRSAIFDLNYGTNCGIMNKIKNKET